MNTLKRVLKTILVLAVLTGLVVAAIAVVRRLRVRSPITLEPSAPRRAPEPEWVASDEMVSEGAPAAPEPPLDMTRAEPPPVASAEIPEPVVFEGGPASADLPIDAPVGLPIDEEPPIEAEVSLGAPGHDLVAEMHAALDEALGETDIAFETPLATEEPEPPSWESIAGELLAEPEAASAEVEAERDDAEAPPPVGAEDAAAPPPAWAVDHTAVAAAEIDEALEEAAEEEIEEPGTAFAELEYTPEPEVAATTPVTAVSSEPAGAPAPAAPEVQLFDSVEEALADLPQTPIPTFGGRSAESYLDEGNVYFNVGQYGLAIERYTKAIEMAPDLVAAYYNRANARTRSGEYDGALADYDSALELQPGDADALNNRGMLHLYRASYAAALADFNAALAIDPSDTTVMVNRGLAHLHSSDAASALIDFQEAAQIDPEDAAASYGAAQAAAMLGSRDRALRFLARALELDPGYVREAAADPKLVALQGDDEFLRLLRSTGSRQ